MRDLILRVLISNYRPVGAWKLTCYAGEEGFVKKIIGAGGSGGRAATGAGTDTSPLWRTSAKRLNNSRLVSTGRGQRIEGRPRIHDVGDLVTSLTATACHTAEDSPVRTWKLRGSIGEADLVGFSGACPFAACGSFQSDDWTSGL